MCAGKGLKVFSTPHGDLSDGNAVAPEAESGTLLGLPRGRLLDDHLELEDREVIDAAALSRLDRWRRAREPSLTVDGVSLVEIFEADLLADVFLRTVRSVLGLEIVASRRRSTSVMLSGVDSDFAQCVKAVFADAGRCAVECDGDAVGAGTEFLGATPAAASPKSWIAAARRVLAVSGIVGLPRGTVFVMPYWNLVPVLRELSERGHPPVLDPLSLSSAELRRAAGGGIRGGWTSLPGRRLNARSTRQVGKAMGAARAARIGWDDPLDELLDQRALWLLEQRSGESLAAVHSFEASLHRGRIKAVVLPFDSPTPARVVSMAARRAGVPVVVVQHGFVGDQGDPDKTRADALAVWSDRDAASASKRRAPPLGVAVTGNPGALAALKRAPFAGRGSILVLVEYPCRYSTTVPARVSIDHVRAALQGIADTNLGLPVVIRPHPADREPDVYLRLAEAWPHLNVSVDVHHSIEDLIAASALCVGATSTATLQAAAAGVPVIMLNVTGRPAPWPLGGQGSVPAAGDAETLGQMLPGATASAACAEDVHQALGLCADAARRVADLVERVSAVRASR